MNTVLVVDLIKGVPCPWPRLESDTHIMSAGSARPLEDAFRIAQRDMVGWVGRTLRARPAGRVPVGHPGGGVAAGQRVRHQLHLDRQDGQALPGVARRARVWTAPTPGCATWPASTGTRESRALTHIFTQD